MSFGYILNPDKKDLRWWDPNAVTPGARDQAEALFAAFRRTASNDQQRMEDYKRFTRIYENRDYLGLGSGSHYRRKLLRQPGTVINVTKQVVDTLVAKLAKTRPHVRFQTFAGNHSLQRKARLLERWVESEQYRSGQERLGPDVFKDCCIYGTGAYKHYAEFNESRVCSERVFPGELFVDHVEAWDGDPSQLFHRKLIDRQVLIKNYPKHKDEILALTPAFSIEEYGAETSLADLIEVVEAHKKGPMGYRCVAANGDKGGIVLAHSPYKKDDFPYTFIRWTRPRRGFWGIGLVEELLPFHLDINKTARQIQKNLRFGNFQVWMDVAAQIKGQKMTNEVGVINTYRGQPPTMSAVDPVSTQQLLWLDQQYQRAFAQAGISADSATGVNTLGADVSGKSRRLFHDLETVRFAIVAREWEWLWLDSAKQYVSLGKELAKRNKDYTVVGAKDRYTVSQVKWEDVDMDEDTYVIRCAPISALSDLPSTRRAEVAELAALLPGEMSPGEIKRLLDMPDIESHMALDRAASENIDRIIEQMLDEEIYEAPEPFIDVQLALKKSQAAYNKALVDEVPEERLALLRRFMADTNKLMQMANAAQAGMAQPGAPGVPPAPGPTGQSPTAVTPADGTAAF